MCMCTNTQHVHVNKHTHTHTQAVAPGSLHPARLLCVILPGRHTTLNLPCECAHLFGTAFPLCSPLELCFKYLKKFGEEAEGLRRGEGAGAEGPEQLLESPTGG